MSLTGSVYGQAYKGLGMARFDFTTHTFKLLLTDASYTVNLNVNEWRSDVTGEISGVGYTTGGTTLTGLSWTTSAAGLSTLTCDNASWSNASFAARYGVIYRVGDTPQTSPLFIYLDFGQTVTSSSSAFPIAWPQGLFTLSN